jgi:hypothetical protein
MSRRRAHDETVLAIVPTHRGFAYTFFEAPLSPIDWGLKHVRGKDKNARSLEVIAQLCRSLRPDTIVIEDCPPGSCRRSPRVRRLFALIVTHAAAENLTLARYSRHTIRTTFSDAGAITRYEIAQAIASYIPALTHRMPRVRRLWQSEDIRFALFDAAALVLTHYAVIPGSEPP